MDSDLAILRERNDLLTRLIALERDARRLTLPEELHLFAVNEIRRVLPCRVALSWWEEGGRIVLGAASGVSGFDPRAPFMQWMAQVCRELAGRHAEAARLPASGLGGHEQAEHFLWLPFLAENGRLPGGLILERETVFSDFEVMAGGVLAESLGRDLWHLKRRRPRVSGGRWLGLVVKGALLGLAGLAMMLPVRQSVLAPAEVAPDRPLVVTSPMDGVIREVLVQPNEEVAADRLLFTLDGVALRNQLEVATRTVAVTRAELMKSAQGAFQDERKKAEIAWLEARVRVKQAEEAYVRELLSRLSVRAPGAGVAIFRDVNDWLGRPVKTGERVLALADPGRVALRIDVPVRDAIALEPGREILFFPNVDPLHPLSATIRVASYEARVTEEGVAAIEVLAAFGAGQTPRLGWKGTAKILGEETRLFYYLFRQPLAAARQMLGV